MSIAYLQHWPTTWPNILFHHAMYKFGSIEMVLNLWDISESSLGPVEMVEQLRAFQNFDD